MPRITPQNILKFMSVNVVTTPTDISDPGQIPYSDRGKKLVWARLVPAFPGVLTNGNGGAVYRVEFLPEVAGQNDPEAFQIYWVEYKGNAPGTATWLGKDAPLMFTALMSGCSFGLGSYTDGGVRAAHVNSASASQTGNPDLAQKQDQHEKLVNLGVTTKVVTIDEYLPGDFDPYAVTTPSVIGPS